MKSVKNTKSVKVVTKRLAAKPFPRKLTDEQVRSAVRMRESGVSCAEVAKLYGISEVYAGQLGKTARVDAIKGLVTAPHVDRRQGLERRQPAVRLEMIQAVVAEVLNRFNIRTV